MNGAAVARPVINAELEGAGLDDADLCTEFVEVVYLRDNPAGLNREYWFHAAGCQSWLLVERDTRTHEIFKVQPARQEQAS